MICIRWTSVQKSGGYIIYSCWQRISFSSRHDPYEIHELCEKNLIKEAKAKEEWGADVLDLIS